MEQKLVQIGKTKMGNKTMDIKNKWKRNEMGNGKW